MIKLSLEDKKLEQLPEVKQWLSDCEKKINTRLTEEIKDEFLDGCLFGLTHGLFVPNDENEKLRTVMMKDLYDFMGIGPC